MSTFSILRRACRLVLAALLVSAAAGVSAGPRFDFDQAGGRLPKDVKPGLVTLALDLDPAREKFSGSVQIEIEVRKAVDAIVLNAHQLTASRARLIDAAGGDSKALHAAPKPTHGWR